MTPSTTNPSPAGEKEAGAAPAWMAARSTGVAIAGVRAPGITVADIDNAGTGVADTDGAAIDISGTRTAATGVPLAARAGGGNAGRSGNTAVIPAGKAGTAEMAGSEGVETEGADPFATADSVAVESAGSVRPGACGGAGTAAGTAAWNAARANATGPVGDVAGKCAGWVGGAAEMGPDTSRPGLPSALSAGAETCTCRTPGCAGSAAASGDSAPITGRPDPAGAAASSGA